ncbi:protein phosphatase 2C domain-containing protein [Rhizohabitans arisaemae]|uniref:protein phosphatase 2C domain-containing protein n=1 Tax=Rhizohabitans arisaemae TaxID=2720610 RepID=UPI0024B2435B|nr:protein phosphatase 2C domain-containing protein [Rhizohabitans arisaemae]
MTSVRTAAAAGLALLTAAVLAGCTGDAGRAGAPKDATTAGAPAPEKSAPQKIAVFFYGHPESRLLAEIYTAVLSARGHDILLTEVKPDGGPTGKETAGTPSVESIRKALTTAGVPAVAAVDTLDLLSGLGRTVPSTVEKVAEAVKGTALNGLRVLDPLKASTRPAFVMLRQVAKQHNAWSLGDLTGVKAAAGWTVGHDSIFAPEWRDRLNAKPHGLRFGTWTATSDPVKDLKEQRIQLALMSTADPRIATNDELLPLGDTENASRPRTMVPLVSDKLGDDVKKIVDEVSASLTTAEMHAMRSPGGDVKDNARRWATTNLPAPEKPGTETREPAEQDSGFPLWTLLILLLIALIGLGVLLLRLRRTAGPPQRGRPAAGQPPQGRPGPQERPVPPNRPERTGQADEHRLTLGPPPRPIQVHLPYGSTSRDSGIALDGGMIGATTVRAASVRGRKHAFRGEPRQDAFAVRLSADRAWVIAAVADGLGSAKHAERAASSAVHAAVEVAEDHLRSNADPSRWDWPAFYTAIADRIRRSTGGLGEPQPGSNAGGRVPRDSPSTTLTVAVIPAGGEGEAVCAAVGDSPAYWLKDGMWIPVFPGKQGDLPENVTAALPANPEDSTVRRLRWKSGDLLVLSSDGFAAAMGDGTSPLASWLAKTWRKPPELPLFLREVDFRLSTFDDDRTVVALWSGRHDLAVT